MSWFDYIAVSYIMRSFHNIQQGSMARGGQLINCRREIAQFSILFDCILQSQIWNFRAHWTFNKNLFINILLLRFFPHYRSLFWHPLSASTTSTITLWRLMRQRQTRLFFISKQVRKTHTYFIYFLYFVLSLKLYCPGIEEKYHQRKSISSVIYLSCVVNRVFT